MVTRAELLEGWSAEEIVRVAPEFLRRSTVPETARWFLAEVGLPRTFPYYFTMVADRYQDPAVDLANGASLIGAYSWQGAELLRLGSNYGQYVCLQDGNGHVIQVPQDPDADGPSFVNSSVEAFAAFLLRVRLRQLAGGLDDVRDEELEARAEVFLGSLRELDPAALAEEEGYWSVVVEQMGYGHL
jgi:hypothetical protein